MRRQRVCGQRLEGVVQIQALFQNAVKQLRAQLLSRSERSYFLSVASRARPEYAPSSLTDKMRSSAALRAGVAVFGRDGTDCAGAPAACPPWWHGPGSASRRGEFLGNRPGAPASERALPEPWVKVPVR